MTNLLNLKITDTWTVTDIITQHLSGIVFIGGCALIVWLYGGFDDWLPKKTKHYEDTFLASRESYDHGKKKVDKTETTD